MFFSVGSWGARVFGNGVWEMIGIYTDSFIKRTCLICNIKEFSAELPSTRTQHHRPPQVVCDFQHRILPLAPTSRLSQQTCMDSAWDWKAELGEFTNPPGIDLGKEFKRLKRTKYINTMHMQATGCFSKACCL